MGISSDLQRIIVARLKAEVGLVGGRVYDSPREDVDMPYISIDASYWNPENAECITARRETVQIDVWASVKPDLSVCKDVTDAVAEALDGWADTDVLTMHGLEISLVRVLRDPDGMTAHGVVQVEAMVERD